MEKMDEVILGENKSLDRVDIRNEFKHLLHPNAVLPVRINKQTVSSSIVTTVLIFFAFYLVLILIGWTALLFLGVGFSESVSTVISSIGNVGPGLGTCGPAYSWNSLPDLAKWILSFLMLDSTRSISSSAFTRGRRRRARRGSASRSSTPCAAFTGCAWGTPI